MSERGDIAPELGEALVAGRDTVSVLGVGWASLSNLRHIVLEWRENLPCLIEDTWPLSWRRPLCDEGDIAFELREVPDKWKKRNMVLKPRGDLCYLREVPGL